jgi:translation initiation factor 1
MGKKGDGLQRLKGLEALADLHRAMGGGRAEIPSEESGPVLSERPEVLYVSRDRKARKGKEVTLVEGFDLVDHDALALETTKALKAHCGVGGAWKEGVVLLQGDHRQRVLAWLEKDGYRVKMKGG